MSFQLINCEPASEGNVRVNVTVAGKADGHEVVFLICPALASLQNMVDLELRRPEATADAAAPAALHQNGIDKLLWDVSHDALGIANLATALGMDKARNCP
jgi:hypothetical protein